METNKIRKGERLGVKVKNKPIEDFKKLFGNFYTLNLIFFYNLKGI